MSILRWFFSFHGRVGRRVFITGNLILGALFSLIGWAQILVIKSVHTQTELLLLTLIPIVIYTFSWLSLAVKRLHDLGRSGFWALGVAFVVFPCKYIGFRLVPSNAALLQVISWIILFIFFAVLSVYPGEEKDNAYGPAHAR